MPQLNNTVEILKVLDKSNCRKCSEATCLAFAVAVAQGQRALNECASIEEDVIQRFGGEPLGRNPSDMAAEEVLTELKGSLRTIDFAATAEATGPPGKHGLPRIRNDPALARLFRTPL